MVCFRYLTSGPPSTLRACGIYEERGPYPFTMRPRGHTQHSITKQTWFPTQHSAQSPRGATNIFSSKLHRGLPGLLSQQPLTEMWEFQGLTEPQQDTRQGGDPGRSNTVK